jgi:hypothetical protein
MAALDLLIPTPLLRQIDDVDVGVSQQKAWQTVRHIDLARSPLVRALFALRTMPERIHGETAETPSLRIEDITAKGNGFRILDEQPGKAITVGAIGKVWQPNIEYADVQPDRFAAFAEPGWVKVAWELRCEPRGKTVTRVVVELRVNATDDESWGRFKRYFQWIGPFSHLIRRHMLGLLVRELGGPERAEHAMALPGDDLIPDAVGQATNGVTIAAAPADIWPWLVQMGCRRAGWYSWDVLDNAGVPSAKEIRQELQSVRVGQLIPATPRGDASFEVLALDKPRTLILGGLHDLDSGKQVSFASPRPAHFAQSTWAFVLEPLDGATTRLHVRVRSAFSPGGLTARTRLMIGIHDFMETAQLRNIRSRVESAQPGAAAKS